MDSGGALKDLVVQPNTTMVMLCSRTPRRRSRTAGRLALNGSRSAARRTGAGGGDDDGGTEEVRPLFVLNGDEFQNVAPPRVPVRLVPNVAVLEQQADEWLGGFDERPQPIFFCMHDDFAAVARLFGADGEGVTNC